MKLSTGNEIKEPCFAFMNQEIKDFQFEKIRNLPIYHMHFRSQALLAYSFLRFQEYYESPFYKGKIFSIDEFIDWYKKEYQKTVFEYHKDWSGFNIPSYVLEPFKKGLFKDLNALEKSFLNVVSKVEESDFYIIGTYAEDNAEKHEIAHGLYHCFPEYKAEMDEILLDYDLSEFYDYLGDTGYHPDVFKDDVQAYSIDDPCILKENDVNLPYIDELSSRCLLVFDKYYKNEC
jgi:hypothetical protein